jgi:malate synthase
MYTLNQETAVLLVRPRGLHLDERHIIINKKASGSLVDFGFVYYTQTMMH